MKTKIQLQDWAVNLFDTPYRTTAIYGGRGGGKTVPVCFNIALKCLTVPNTQAIILREFKKTGEDGALKEVYKQAYNIAPNKVKYTRAPAGIAFTNGSTVIVLGSERNIDNLRDALNHADIVFLEESHTLSESAYNTFRPSIRAEGAKIIYAFNPRYKTDVVSQLFIENPSKRTRVIRVNYLDYPEFRNAGLDEEMAEDLERGNPNFSHVWYGEYVTEVGAVFDMTKLNDCTRAEFLNLPGKLQVGRGWDFAATEGGGDWTVGTRILRKDDKYFIDDIHRVQRDPGGVQRKFRECLHIDCGEPDMPNIDYFIEQEAGSGGKIAAEGFVDIAREFGVSCYAVRSTGKKVDRAVPFAAAMNSGKVYADKNNPWHEDFVMECVAFSAKEKDYKHDDQVDAASLCYNELASRNVDSDWANNIYVGSF